MKLSALIGWNILSSLNAVFSTNERNRIYNRSHGYNPSYNQILQPKETDRDTVMILSKLNFNPINNQIMTHFLPIQGIPTKQVWIWWSLPILGCRKPKVYHTFGGWYGCLKHFLPRLPKQQVARPAQNWRFGQGPCQKIQDHGSWNLEGMR